MNEQLEPLFDKKVTCLLCNSIFATKKVRSRFGLARSMESDFFTEYVYGNENINPILYYVNVCPNCGYAFAAESSNYFLPGMKEEIMDKVTSQWRAHTRYSGERTPIDAVATYKLAIFSGMIKRERPIIMAGLHMRLSWMYRALNNIEEDSRFSRFALKAYEKAYFEGDFTNSNMSSIRVAYLIGELYRRMNDFEKASVYFSKIIHIKEAVKDRRFVEMARDQWYIMREQLRDKKQKLTTNKSF